jgi:LPPG:FO 2-phospho-L-lactate transferase
MYTLAGLANPATGWGQANESWNFLDALGRLGGETWFRLGDRDLATHLERRRRLATGETLTEVTQALSQALGIGPRLLPMSDEPVRTMVQTDEGELAFQEYFVHRQCRPRVSGFRFAAEGEPQPTKAVLAALDQADLIVICPSNPFVSLGPILHLAGVRERLERQPGVAVTPIIGGQALKGPAGKMLAELGLPVSPVAVAQAYGGLIDRFVLDEVDAHLEPEIAALGLRVLVTDTVMHTDSNRARLAEEVIGNW